MLDAVSPSNSTARMNEDIFDVFWFSVSGLLISMVYSTGLDLFTPPQETQFK